MRSTFLPLATVALALSTMVSVPACATGEEVKIEESADDAGTPTPVTPVADAGTKETAAPTCVTSCSADSECQNSCPSTTSGSACCDTATHKCYHNTASTCPVPEVDSGTNPGPY